MKFGFAVQVMGQQGLKSNDTRRWQNNPHLSVSLAYVRDILRYLDTVQIKMYRFSSDLAPYLTHPDLPQFHRQIEECADELAAVGKIAIADGVRVSFHPAAYTVLNSPDKDIAQKAILDLNAQVRMLDLMELGPEAVVVIHVGGLYGDQAAAIERFVARYQCLPEPTRRRLVLENDDRSFSLRDTYAIHEQTGIRLIFDSLHNLCNPAPDMSPHQALGLALSTWPEQQTPKIHYSSPRTSVVVNRDGTVREPRLSAHSDLIDPFAFSAFLNEMIGLRNFDVMLECKAKDVALLRLRRHLEQFHPDLVRIWKLA